MKYEIYIITNIVNAKQYVGITKRLHERWLEHKRASSKSAINSAIKKYGYENFVFTHIATAYDHECAQQIEQSLIAEHGTKAPFGYNLTDGGEGVHGIEGESKQRMLSALSLKNKSDKQKNAVRKANSGKKQTPELIEKRISKIKGRKQSPEEIAKRVASRKANNKPSPIVGNTWNVGRKLSPETIAKRTATQAINKAKKMKELA